MNVGLLGRKVGMTQIYEPDGTAIPVTVLECGPCTVLQVRTEERDGYHAVQLGFADKKRKSASQAERGHAKKVQAEPKKFVREIRQEAAADGVAEGQTLTVEVFNDIKNVDVVGTSKGRGFTGVLKRHGFKGLRATHGVKRMHRHPGSSRPVGRPLAHPQGDQEARPARQRPGHRAEPQGRPRRPHQQPASGPRRGAGPQRRLPHDPPDEQGLVVSCQSSVASGQPRIGIAPWLVLRAFTDN